MKDVDSVEDNIIKYFAGGNTSQGFYNLFASNLANLERLFILKGGPGTGKSYLIQKVGNAWKAKGYALEYMYCSSDKDSVDGIIIPALKVGIVDGTKPHIIEPKYPGIIDDYVDLGAAWDASKLHEHKDAIMTLTDQVNAAFQAAYKAFGEALIPYEKRKARVSKTLNVDKVKALTERLVKTLFREKGQLSLPTIKHRFHGALTPTGPYSFIEKLIEPVGKRYFLQGRPGTGKSTLLRRLLLEAEMRGFNAEVYHCEFEPDAIDLLIIRELDIAIFDNKTLYELQPERETDEVIDMEQAVLELTVHEEDQTIIKEYEHKLNDGMISLTKAKSLRDVLEGYYIQAMDFTISANIRHKIETEIEQIEQDFIRGM